MESGRNSQALPSSQCPAGWGRVEEDVCFHLAQGKKETEGKKFPGMVQGLLGSLGWKWQAKPQQAAGALHLLVSKVIREGGQAWHMFAPSKHSHGCLIQFQ